MKTITLGLVVAAAVLAAVLFLRGRVGTEVLPPATDREWAGSKAPGNPSPEMVLAIRPGLQPVKRPPAAAAKGSPLMRESQSGPWKPLYDRLAGSTSRTPEENYLLAEILQICGNNKELQGAPRQELRDKARERYLSTVSEKDPTREKRVAAYTRQTENRCAGFENVSSSPAEIMDLLQKAAAAGDPKARARLVEKEIWAPLTGADGLVRHGPDGRLPSISDAQLAALRDAVAANDFQALRIAGRVLSSTMSDLVIRTGPQERPVDPRVFNDAWELAACDAGYDCGPDNPTLAFACYAQGNCDAQDLREHLFFYANSPQQSQLLAEYQAQITRAIQTRDWSWFQFHRGEGVPGMIYSFARP